MSAACIGGQNQDAVAGREPCAWIADKPVSVEAREQRRMQATGIDQGAERRKSALEYGQQLAERLGVELKLGDAGALPRNAEKFNTHDVRPASRRQFPCYHATPSVLLSQLTKGSRLQTSPRGPCLVTVSCKIPAVIFCRT